MTQAQPHIAVLFGGDSNEAAVSRSSAREVIAALATTFTQITEVDLSNDFVGLLTGTANTAGRPDVVFPVLHGPPGEDGTVQGLLEMMNLPYVGCGVEASAFAMNKITAKHIFRSENLPVADDLVIPAETDAAIAAAQILATLGSSVVVKPSRQGSALGVTPVHNDNELLAAVVDALKFGNRLLIEQRILGREITVGVLDTPQHPDTVLPVVEVITPDTTWYDYEHRYTVGKSEHLVPAPLTEEVSAELQRIALSAHQALGCRDLSRADFVLTPADEPVLLEVNTMPGMTATSLYPDAAAAAGLDFPTLLAELVFSALARR